MEAREANSCRGPQRLRFKWHLGTPLKGQDMNMEQEEEGEVVGLLVKHLCFVPEDEKTGGPGSQKGLTHSASWLLTCRELGHRWQPFEHMKDI